MDAAAFTARVHALADPVEKEKLQRYFKTGPGEYGEGDVFLGVRVARLSVLCKEFIDLPPVELDILLGSPLHEVRAGALSIMDRQARRRRTPEDRRRELYELYLRRLDRINNWDLVDMAAPYVVGGYLHRRDRAPLYELAASPNLWARRTAVLATAYFVRADEFDDTLALAEILVRDKEDLLHKAVGWWLREVGNRDQGRLLAFLDRHAAAMPRVMLRYAIERLPEDRRRHYRELKRVTA
ncbi:DNA alkylation repair protein [Crossiella sp. CA-258035]|uniref:DNA alkylation repair protein n=1 Tax=Crossiella sp. CA-258035 TaxID=2981138 RepID=UPI0024BBF4F2|nr:DNA alkylation repair protein [Crossiella sp. CA-258035]WHT22288.1 DNA alkylation repair protein [Crossiella sp. CA-258035]